MVPEMRFERTTYWLRVSCSTDWSYSGKMVIPAGIKPAASTLREWCLNQFDHGTTMERMAGIEPV